MLTVPNLVATSARTSRNCPGRQLVGVLSRKAIRPSATELENIESPFRLRWPESGRLAVIAGAMREPDGRLAYWGSGSSPGSALTDADSVAIERAPAKRAGQGARHLCGLVLIGIPVLSPHSRRTAASSSSRSFCDLLAGVPAWASMAPGS